MLFVLQSFANQFPSLEILDLSNNFIATVEEMVIFLLKKLIKEARKVFSLHVRAQSTPRCTRQLNESKYAHRKLNAA